ncbi:MAG TPA: tryptophan--tRNA ligase [Amaricoccus sp.]|uniref:tryptophan--tRNA ligase n=1 Tax=Amaricoccus sp. TaxID=1872485 RepID=UPI002BE1C6E6|nr:tryptophan--tRNA ligase [Amaricoccus sp.]HMQ92406.1 tryptophan--tRNA ligase [Amaricoccus sp.]HMR53145.1 tryptophan--tRNA ligase [Amaricoccus sp.]HMR59418.1 tryptophan--tRNA ligase [Amaricoccus sp.]HMU00001.1 tryptophan--tRNA ligase [Amaricoccus sp.]
MSEPKFEPRVFSGAQPSGNLTLGNYLGALRRWVAMQDEGLETIYCVVDLHAITVWQDPAKLAHATRELAAAYLACGLDPARSILFNQSQVPAHAELAWVFNCVARLGWLNRMTQFKDKAGKDREAASAGLYVYPNLMAADILVYHATHVPVGEDQKQHVELTRDIAAKFNHDFGTPFFPLAEPIIEGAATRVMSLRDGSKKMSKSDPSDMSRINLSDDADAIAQKIRRARTDSAPLPDSLTLLADRPEARNLLTIYSALAERPPETVLEEFAGAPFSVFKPALAELAVARLGPITARMTELMADPAEIDRILGDGADRAAAIAEPILARTYEIVGLVRSRPI